MLKTKDLFELIYFIEIGLATGKPWVSVFVELNQRDKKDRLKKFVHSFLSLSSQVGVEAALKNFRSRARVVEVGLFFELLLLSEQASREFRSSLSQFREMIYQMEIIRKKGKSFFLTSKFQAVSAILVSLFLSLGVPFLFPEWSPSFFDSGRYDLWILGWGGLLAGIAMLFYLSYWPLRNQQEEMKFILFLHLNSLFIRSGQSLKNSWKRSLQCIDFSKSWQVRLSRVDLLELKFEDYLLCLAEQMRAPWSDFARSLEWVVKSGSSLYEYFQEASKIYRESYLYHWEETLKKASLIALLPLYFICLPASLFLAMGPWFWVWLE